jgi:hypothetical protein
LRGLTLLLAFTACLAHAQARKEQTQIDALIAAIENSGCRMQRNGAEHEAKAAAAHLRMKLEKAGSRVQTAEQFIERVAAGSSASGEPYRVLCAGQPPQASRDWLRSRLNY